MSLEAIEQEAAGQGTFEVVIEGETFVIERKNLRYKALALLGRGDLVGFFVRILGDQDYPRFEELDIRWDELAPVIQRITQAAGIQGN